MNQPSRRIAREGDLVILYERKDAITPVILKAGDKYQSLFGAFLHDDIIGKEYGSIVEFSFILVKCRLRRNLEINMYMF